MFVFAKESVSLGRGVRVVKGEARYERDPLVRSHPDLFSPIPPVIQRTPGWSPEAEVEQASAAPGEKRTVRRAG